MSAVVLDLLEHQLRKSVEMTAEDRRWMTVRPDTPVLFDGEWCTWGDLAGNERTECEFNEQGVLVGSMPF